MFSFPRASWSGVFFLSNLTLLGIYVSFGVLSKPGNTIILSTKQVFKASLCEYFLLTLTL